VADGDAILGLASSGLHSNGYSLARKIVFDAMGLGVASRVPELEAPIGRALLTPTRIYVRSILPLAREGALKAMAHITGSGLPGNLTRAFPEGAGAEVDRNAWPKPPVFDVLRRGGEVAESEMYDVFNMGVGFAVVVAPADKARVADALRASGETVWEIGRVTASGAFAWKPGT
ncbi:MAG: phosphoribosylformylglycinamidine cyclo-ligase, partial [Candidatus Methylomirabilis sp.]|nr:phosphoribosylformylglycinamidine cyclo-ligase [Deltaproteobacteria bacterium]